MKEIKMPRVEEIIIPGVEGTVVVIPPNQGNDLRTARDFSTLPATGGGKPEGTPTDQSDQILPETICAQAILGEA